MQKKFIYFIQKKQRINLMNIKKIVNLKKKQKVQKLMEELLMKFIKN